MNVAEEVADAGPVKRDRAFRSGFVQAQVEPPSVIQRKNVVKKRVLVRKFHHGSNRDDQNMRLERLVALYQSRRLRLYYPFGGAHRGTTKRYQPYRHIRGVWN